MHQPFRPAAALVAVLLAFSACNRAPDRASAASLKPEKQRKAAPDFSLKDSEGKAVKLSDYKGKVVLLNFWATWCGPCKIEIPWFVEFEQKFKDRGFAVLGVAMDEEGWDVVRPYIQDKRVNYRVILGDDVTAQIYGGVESLPTTFMIDQEGRIASIHIGLISKSDYQNEIMQLLESGSRLSRAGGPLGMLLRAK